MPQGRWTLWGVATSATATGRVLADVHWVSDCLAAAGLGVSLVWLLASASRLVLRAEED